MSRRCVHKEALEIWTAKVYWDSDTQEYVVRLYVRDKLYVPADYFDTDKESAKATARDMVASAWRHRFKE